MTQCRKCGEEIIWKLTERDRWTPENTNGTPHWTTCPEAATFRKPKSNIGRADKTLDSRREGE